MNRQELLKVLNKYKEGYYHSITKYNNRFKEKTLLTCDHIDIVYDLYKCNITKQDIDFIAKNKNEYSSSYKFDLLRYIRKLEKENKLEKALIHLGWYFLVEENRKISFYLKEKMFNKLYIRPMQTLVEFYIRDYKSSQHFREMNKIFDNIINH